MASDSGESPVRADELTFTAEIALTEDKRHQFAYLHGMNWFRVCRHQINFE
jgi:hypothetical protein